MSAIMPLQLVYLTLPMPNEPILNLHNGDAFVQFRLTRNQLYNLNCDIADALIRGKLSRDKTQQELPICPPIPP